MRRDHTKVLVRIRPTLCKIGSDLCAKGRATKVFNDGDLLLAEDG